MRDFRNLVILNKLSYMRNMSTASKWILGIVIAFAGFALLAFAMGMFMISSALTTASTDTYEESFGGSTAERVALITLESDITTAEDIIEQLRKYRKRSSVKAIVLRLDSPGGAVVPSHEIYEEVKRTRNLGTPVVVSMGSVAASGAYYIACGASSIVANPGTITGSIGVVATFTNAKGLMDKIGIEQTTVKSGEFKDAGSPVRRMTDSERQYFQETIDNVFGQFVDIVAEARGMSTDSVRIFADGRIFTGEQAYGYGLVDTLGTLQTAIAIAGTLGKISGEPRVVRELPRQSVLDLLTGEQASTALSTIGSALRGAPPVQYKLMFH